jgi:hypothetical protein
MILSVFDHESSCLTLVDASRHSWLKCFHHGTEMLHKSAKENCPCRQSWNYCDANCNSNASKWLRMTFIVETTTISGTYHEWQQIMVNSYWLMEVNLVNKGSQRLCPKCSELLKSDDATHWKAPEIATCGWYCLRIVSWLFYFWKGKSIYRIFL